MDDSKKIGIGLTGFGLLFFMLGVMLFFDRGLLAMGNILFLSGVALTIGPSATLKLFTSARNAKGALLFGFGFFLVVIKWPLFGFLIQSYGFLLLFRGFLPTVVMFLRQLPVVGTALNMPGVKTVINKIAPASTPLPV